jgi:octaprenyl-diphosphate synthase
VANPLAASSAAGDRSLAASRFVELISDKLVATEELFRQELGSDVPFIDQAGSYILDGGGKRLRPALLLLTARLLGHNGEEEVTYAAVVEFIHNATLIHDDIIDHAHLRRGQPTLNRLWGNNLTVLLGDWIYTKAMQMALSHGQIEVVERLCAATLKMTEGELLALARLGKIDLGVDEYFEIIDRKTAHLFAAACSLPCLIPPHRHEAGQVLSRYGRALGTCFQLVDDLLDFTARESELGKPVLSDLKEGKLTLPLILALPRLAPAERALVDTVLTERSFNLVTPEQILELVAREGTIEETVRLAEGYATRAQQELAHFPPGDARDALEFAPEFVLHRRPAQALELATDGILDGRMARRRLDPQHPHGRSIVQGRPGDERLADRARHRIDLPHQRPLPPDDKHVAEPARRRRDPLLRFRHEHDAGVRGAELERRGQRSERQQRDAGLGHRRTVLGRRLSGLGPRLERQIAGDLLAEIEQDVARFAGVAGGRHGDGLLPGLSRPAGQLREQRLVVARSRPAPASEGRRPPQLRRMSFPVERQPPAHDPHPAAVEDPPALIG